MTATAWAHLPNAQHIDWVIASISRDPQVWNAAWRAVWSVDRKAAWDAARDASRDAAQDAAQSAVRDNIWSAIWYAARNAARDSAQGSARDTAQAAARNATWDACAAFAAWDDASDVWAMPTDAVRLLAAVGESRAALLLPACIVRDTKGDST